MITSFGTQDVIYRKFVPEGKTVKRILLPGAGKVIEADFDSAATVPRALLPLHKIFPS